MAPEMVTRKLPALKLLKNQKKQSVRVMRVTKSTNLRINAGIAQGRDAGGAITDRQQKSHENLRAQ